VINLSALGGAGPGRVRIPTPKSCPSSLVRRLNDGFKGFPRRKQKGGSNAGAKLVAPITDLNGAPKGMRESHVS
jgi:hypothetical protein